MKEEWKVINCNNNYVNAGKISYVSNDYCESKYTEACGNGENSESC